MKCLYPRLISNPNYDDRQTADQAPLMLVPCGKCHACLSARRRQWVFRLQQEALYSKKTLFVTLTYSDEYHDGFLHKGHLLNFIRRCKYNWKKSIKYYAIGEHGTQTKRAHYHILLFIKDNIQSDFDWIKSIRSLWPYGNVKVGDAKIKAINYVCHYHVRPKRVEISEGVFSYCFCLMSKGLGLQFITEETLKIINSREKKDVFDWFGNHITLPRYYRKKFSIDPPSPFYDDKSLLQIAKERYVDPFELLQDLRDLDREKLTKYNNQEKF